MSIESRPDGHRNTAPSPGRRMAAMRVMSMPVKAALSAILLASIVGCGTPSPPARLVYLPSALPPGVTVSQATSHQTWQLMSPLLLPEYLDRDALLLPQGQAGLQAMPGWRWAEPLREEGAPEEEGVPEEEKEKGKPEEK